MDPRTSMKQTELSSLGFLNVENRVKQFCSYHGHKIFNYAYPSYLKSISLKINEHHKQNNRSSHFNYLIPKINDILLQCNSGLELTT